MGRDCSTRLLSPGNRGLSLAEPQGCRGAATPVDRAQDPPWAHTWLSMQPWAPPHLLSRVPSASGLPACAGGPRPLPSHLLRSPFRLCLRSQDPRAHKPSVPEAPGLLCLVGE